jgi:hypothetical protein
MNDRYTKAVLTVIAAALVVLAVERVMPVASAQSSACGVSRDPCYVMTAPGDFVSIENRRFNGTYAPLMVSVAP